jgi:UDP-glucose 4-epimerase
MKALVTGCAGFIGSHLTDELLQRGYEVKGIDCFSSYYPKWIKKNNLQYALANRRFQFIESSIQNLNLKSIVKNVDCVFHEAAQAGVRKSWGEDFKIYVDNNILVTQQLLEACKASKIRKFVFASSSSVYGNTEAVMGEEDFPRPVSPYGASKLACESLCYLYWKNYAIPVISLRYFTVYGERQRPDMAFHKFIKAILNQDKIVVYGDGKQTRSFTYVGDIVDATLSAAECSSDAEVINIGGGSQISVNETIEILQQLLGRRALVEYCSDQKGDVRHTHADITKSERILGYKPKVGFREGLQSEVESIKALYRK